MISRRAVSSGSDEVSSFRAFNFASENRTRHTLCRSNGSLLGRGLSLDIVSARSISVPGLYLISRSYPCILSNILWSRGGAAREILQMNHFEGFVIRLYQEPLAKQV